MKSCRSESRVLAIFPGQNQQIT